MFSGGLDSTAAFFKLMNEKKSLHVHHINLVNIENRHKAEKIAVDNICEYMKSLGNFVYSESTHETPSIKGNFFWDSDIYNFMAGSICMLSKIKTVALGLTKTDLGSGENVKKRIERGNDIIKSFGSDIKKIYPVVDMTKKEIYDFIPNDLRNLTWSCRTPEYDGDIIKKCNNCKSCKELRSIPNYN